MDVPWLHPISTKEGIEIIELALQSARSLGAFRLNAEKLASAFPNLTALPLLGGLLGDHENQDAPFCPGVTELRDYDPLTARELVAGQVRARIASVLGWAPSELDEISPLPALGVDSLLAVRIRNGIEHDFALTLPLSLVLQGASVTGLIEWLLAELGFTATEKVSTPVAVPPRDAAERLVVSVCREVLGTTVGVTDKLTDLCQARHVREIAKLLTGRGRRVVTVANVRDFPTPELLAQCVRESATDEPVRVLREGSTNPLFCFHPGGGNTEVFSQLAGLLPQEVPVFGLDRIDDTDTVEQRVKRYLPELLRQRGPYRLIGWSFGGFLAFEAAQQLTALGRDVELLALIDPILPLPVPAELSEVELARQRFGRFADFLESSYGRRIPLPYERLASLDPREQAELLTATIRASGVINEQVSEAILRHQRASHLDARILDQYSPSVYSGRVLFYSAQDAVPGGLRDPRYDRADLARGWDAFCPDLDLVVVPGHHLSLLDPPHVEVIAEHLSTYLRRVR